MWVQTSILDFLMSGHTCTTLNEILGFGYTVVLPDHVNLGNLHTMMWSIGVYNKVSVNNATIFHVHRWSSVLTHNVKESRLANIYMSLGFWGERLADRKEPRCFLQPEALKRNRAFVIQKKLLFSKLWAQNDRFNQNRKDNGLFSRNSFFQK